MKQPPLLNTFHTNILKQYIFHPVPVACIYSHTSLIRHIIFIMFQNINIAENQILNNLSCRRIRITMTTYIDRMSNIRPKNGILVQ